MKEYIEVYEQIEGTNDHPIKARIDSLGMPIEEQDLICETMVLPKNWYAVSSCLYSEEMPLIPLDTEGKELVRPKRKSL